MSKIYLKLRCYNRECGKLYNARFCYDIKLLSYRIDFSVCNYCRVPRNIKLAEKYLSDWHCWGCGIPGIFLLGFRDGKYKKTGKYCSLCYQQDWYTWKGGRRFKREVAIKRDIVLLI